MKQFLGIILIILGVIGGLYVGGWLLFIQPIITCCKAFDANTLTGLMVGITIIKCIFASIVGSIIGYLGIFTGSFIMYS